VNEAVSGKPGRLRRYLRWRVAAIAAVLVAAVAFALFVTTRDGDDTHVRSAPCRAVVQGTRELGRGERSEESLLELVRAQAPLARADAGRHPDAGHLAVADTMDAIRADLEAGRRFPEVVVLYDLCR
jgi:hypothetical protein